MSELVLVPCDACGGDGYTLGLGGTSGDGLPAETTCRCDVCGGAGKVEVCEGCLEVPTVAGGLELCACVSVSLRRAA
ncbi:MAG: hypothetical protein AVDCRST_MAG86-2322 [uncultured Truepera sp.]|uniref:Uncharacterized protein n=1 Tax=uncultured Truepera sp. TaxID=543023 RepID=A0A6J4VFM4_9DEIN|nr:MAG: hypothetical protein AVDCRST_MAG86-2322 [uncultured Truepera sp.]